MLLIVNKKLFWNFLAGVVVIGAMIFLFIWSDNISKDNTGTAYQTEKIIRSIIILATAWFCTKLVTLLFLNPINEKRKKNLPNIVKDILGAIIYFAAIALIITEVYGETMSSLGAFFISSWAIIGFAAQDLIKDCINGISIDLQADFKLGDWVQFKDGTIGKIIKMKMTTVDLLLPNDTILYISNTMLNNDPMINLSNPQRDYYINIKVVLEHKVPVGRARRILLAAAATAPGVYNNDVSVYSESVQENGVVYVIFFRIPDRSVWLESRHQVIQSVTEYLHKFGLKICQITGEIHLNSTPSSIVFDDKYVTSPLMALKISNILENCAEEALVEFSKYMKLRKFQSQETIIKQNDDGDSMFIIAEGVVDVDRELELTQDDSTSEAERTVENQRVGCLVDGEYFGEMGLLLGEKRTATVKARTDVILYEIDRETVKKVVEKYPDFVDKISTAIAKRKLKNQKLEDELIKQKEEDEKTISELVNAFRKYLWDRG